MSRPRPIHSKPRELNEKPSPNEPPSSFEEENFYLNDDFMSAAEQFHSKRGDYYSYTPHPSATTVSSSAAAASGGRAGRGSTRTRTSSNSGGGRPLTAHPVGPQTKASQRMKSHKAQNSETPLSPSEQRKFKIRHSFNDIVMLEHSELHETSHRSPNAYPSFPDTLRGKTKRNESSASTISSVTEESVPEDDASKFIIDVSGGIVLRLPKTPEFRWKSVGETSQASTADVISPSPDFVKAQHQYIRKDSSSSLGRKDAKREAKKRTKARMLKQGAMLGSFEFGHDSEGFDDSASIFSAGASLADISEDSFVGLQGRRGDSVKEKLGYVRNYPGKKKLVLKDLNLTGREVPIDAICSYPLGPELSKLSLAGNQLNYLHHRLTLELVGMRTLDLQQCGLASIPDRWDLPNLRRLDLSHNRLKSFLPKGALEGLPCLEHLDMNNNELCEWTIPDGAFLTKLEYLNLDFNEIIELPGELTRLQSLRYLKVSNNYITHIPERVCNMPLNDLLVTPNPLIQPPNEDCEQGIDSMRRYYIGLAKIQNYKASAARRRRARKKDKKASSKDLSAKSSSKDANDDSAGMSDSIKAHVSNQANRHLVSDKETLSSQLVTPYSEVSPSPPQHLCDPCGPSSSIQVSSGTEDQELNDTLKIIFVGMGSIGKTTIIKRLKEGPDAEIPKREERTIGVDINEWNPKEDCNTYGIEGSPYKTQVVQEDKCMGRSTAHIKFSVWDFAGQDVYHATHEIFFSRSALYVLVWDMAAKNMDVRRRPKVVDIDDGWEDSSDEEHEEIYTERELLRAERALEKDIDEKVQYWVNCIQSRVPGAAILPVASFDDAFDDIENGGPQEARRRVNKMKKRLLDHERRRVEGLEERLRILKSGNRASSQEASRIMELLSPFHRPKLIFGGEGDPESVLRVSGTDLRGFDRLREKIILLATGRELPAASKHPLFRGHVGSPIPPIRLRIREFIRQKKAEKKFQVIELRYFLSMLEEYLGYTADSGQIGDALRFLSRIGELSFFGDFQTPKQISQYLSKESKGRNTHEDSSDDEEGTDYVQIYESDDRGMQGSLVSQNEDSGICQFIFLDPKWLAATLGCILRHDLKQQIEETRYVIERDIQHSSRWQSVGRGEHFHDANKNCPIVTAAEACMLWKARKKIRKAAERSILNESSFKACPFEFMQELLVHFSVFVPIDLNIDRAFLGGHDFSTKEQGARFFFLPSQLSPWDSSDKIWTYKSNDSWKTCLCHSWLFPDGSPPGLFEHVTASVLRDLYAVTSDNEAKKSLVVLPNIDEQIGQLYFREILCWKTAFNIVLGKTFVGEDGDLRESRVEVWAHLIDQDSKYCVAGKSTPVGTRRLIVSGKGLEGHGCRKIWEGGYEIVLKAVERVITEYGGLEYTKQGVCPECLATRDLCCAKMWDWTSVQDAIKRGPGTITCENGHRIDIRHVGGRVRLPRTFSDEPEQLDANSRVPFSDLCGAVVLVGLWDGEQKRIVMAGSGFVVDNKRGLIVTAGHVLIDMAKGESFGADYYGLQHGRAVIGVITQSSKAQGKCTGLQACFRYFADIVAKNPRNMDACVLRINSKIRKDVGGDGSDCGRQISEPLSHREDFANESLQKLKPTSRCEYEEEVRIIGYSQGGEGLVQSPRLNRVIEVVKGSIVKIYKARDLYHKCQLDQNCFRPYMEIVINCPTIGGQSGGPCVNQSGKVIGILSREDPEDKTRCYLVPAKEFMELVNVAKSWDD